MNYWINKSDMITDENDPRLRDENERVVVRYKKQIKELWKQYYKANDEHNWTARHGAYNSVQAKINNLRRWIKAVPAHRLKLLLTEEEIREWT